MNLTKPTMKEILEFNNDHGVPVEKIKERFESTAYDKYMEEYLELAPEFTAYMNASIKMHADELQLNGGGDVLLISVGSGRDIPNLALHKNTYLNVTAIDINPNMTKGAISVIKDSKLEDRIDIVDDMQVSEVKERLGENKYDLVLWAYSGSCVPNRLESWNSVVSTVKKRGIFIFTDYIGAIGDRRYSEVLRAQQEARDIIRAEGVKLYKPEDIPSYIDLTVPNKQIGELRRSNGQKVISIAGDIKGVKEPTIIFDTLNPVMGLSEYFEKKSLTRLDYNRNISDQVSSNCIFVYQKR